MPIGVPRIIYCWGEELPAQWTDIYNFIFRRRMVFLMQYLDDELCNQICGLLINIHMEDRSKELEKKEMERSGVFKSGQKPNPNQKGTTPKTEASFYNKKQRSMEDLLNADEDLGIEEIDTLEQLTLQKITTEWLNWNAQFFDYSDEPYLFYLAELLSKDFNNNKEIRSPLNSFSKVRGFEGVFFKKEDPLALEGSMTPQLPSAPLDNNEIAQLLQMLKNNSVYMNKKTNANLAYQLNVYSPFRTHANFWKSPKQNDLSLNDLTNSSLSDKEKLLKMFQEYQTKSLKGFQLEKAIYNLLSDLSKKDFIEKLISSERTPRSSVEKTLSQRNLRKEYNFESNLSSLTYSQHSEGMLTNSSIFRNSLNNNKKFVQKTSYLNESPFNYLSNTSLFNMLGEDSLKGNFSGTFGSSEPLLQGAGSKRKRGGEENESSNEFRSYYRKQTERALIEEESKKVFVIINSFGGSVGNGVTVHDALQFIKAGSLTLGLGVAASAASLALAGGTIGERYVTEGCHVMIHQPEGSLQGQASDIWIDSQEIMKIRLDVAEIYSLSTYRPRHKILRDLDRDFYLTASETIHYGLADEIATNEVMHEIIEMTSKVWDYHDSKQQRLLESRESASSGLDTQTQN